MEENRPGGGASASRDYTAEELARQALGSLDPARLAATSPAVVAHFLEHLEVNERRSVLRQLPDECVSEVLAEMDGDDAAEVFSAMREHRAVTLLEDFEPDDAADVVGELTEEDRSRLLGKMEPESAEEIKSLLTYGPETAGGIMTPEVAAVEGSATVDQAIALVREMSEDREDLNYVYVVDAEKRLLGILSLRQLILSKSSQRAGQIMAADIRGKCLPETDREEVALLMAELNLPSIAVVDAESRLLGEVTHDDVIDILQDEATEDIQKFVGAGPDESIHDAISAKLRSRTPWLQVNLLTAFLAAGIILRFEEEIGRLPLLAAFMPVIASLGGNAGHQALAVAIRSLALDEVRDSHRRAICVRELALGLINGLMVGLLGAGIVFLVSRYLLDDPRSLLIGLAVLLAMILNMGLAGLAGAFIPLLLKKMKFDPAQSSSIFLTALTDMAGFFIFLCLGSWLLL